MLARLILSFTPRSVHGPPRPGRLGADLAAGSRDHLLGGIGNDAVLHDELLLELAAAEDLHAAGIGRDEPLLDQGGRTDGLAVLEGAVKLAHADDRGLGMVALETAELRGLQHEVPHTEELEAVASARAGGLALAAATGGGAFAGRVAAADALRRALGTARRFEGVEIQ